MATMEEIAVKLEGQEHDIKSLLHRTKNLENQSNETQELVLAVNKLAINMEHMLAEQRAQNKRLSKLEEEPADRWNSIKRTAITTVISTISGALAISLIYLVSQYI